MKKLLLLIFFVLSFYNMFSQNNDADFEAQPTSINDVIKQVGYDTIIFYYDERWNMVKPVCATTFRISRIDTVLFTFTGPFIEYYTYDSTTAIEGKYLSGKKQGLFNIYYPNGQLEQFGNYSNDKKTGIWEYFYEDGSRRQILDFHDHEILIKDFWNEEGKKLVDAGNGEWFGYETSEKFMKISGEVLNGRRNGTWKKTIPSRNITTIIEKYNEGKFVSGKMISLARGTNSYKDTIHCSIDIIPAFLTAEQFQVSRCYKVEKNNWAFAKYPGGMERFYKQIKERIILTEPPGKKKIIKIITSIDLNGKMTNFKQISNTGYEFDLIKVLQTMDNWTPTKVNGKATIQSKIISFEIW